MVSHLLLVPSTGVVAAFLQQAWSPTQHMCAPDHPLLQDICHVKKGDTICGELFPHLDGQSTDTRSASGDAVTMCGSELHS